MSTVVALPKLTSTLDQFVLDLKVIEPLLDALSDVVFFIKNESAQYIFVNQTLASRCGYQNKQDMLNLTSEQVFSGQWGQIYTQQDFEILKKQKKLNGQLELHLYNKYESGWCLTYKEPLYDAQGHLVGISGISKDLNATETTHAAFHKVALVEQYIKNNISKAIVMSDLTAITQTSLSQLERYCKRVYKLTPRQMINRYRLDRACELLKRDLNIIDISLKCGYTDHSAFCRQFKAHIGMSPTQYRLYVQKTASS